MCSNVQADMLQEAIWGLEQQGEQLEYALIHGPMVCRYSFGAKILVEESPMHPPPFAIRQESQQSIKAGPLLDQYQVCRNVAMSAYNSCTITDCNLRIGQLYAQH